MPKEERDVLEEMRKTDECDMGNFSALDSSEKAIAILRYIWWPQKAKKEWDKLRKHFFFHVIYGQNVIVA